LLLPGSAEGRARLQGGVAEGPDPAGLQGDHHGDPRRARVLLRGGLPPAVPGEESLGLLWQRRHRRELPRRARHRLRALGRRVATLCLFVAAATGGCAWIGSAGKPGALRRGGRGPYPPPRHDEALVQLERATAPHPPSWTAHLYLARCYMAKENWTVAIAEARLAYETQPDGEEVEEVFSAALLGGGAAAVHTERFTLAIADFSEYVSLHPNDARGFLGLGRADD